jgi:hypothetical protein
MEPHIAWGLTTLAGSFTGSYLASYLKKKGENRAIREDLDDLLEQVRAVTTATKEIEAKISTTVWDRQKHWEIKRDVLFEAARRLAAVEDSLMYLNNAYRVDKERQQKGEPGWVEGKQLAADNWTAESRKFDETRMLVTIACGDEVKKACSELIVLTRQIAVGIYGQDQEIYGNSVQEFVKKSVAVTDAIRKELGTV